MLKICRVTLRALEREEVAVALSTYRTGGRLYKCKLDGAQEARLIALASGTPPEGRARWTLRLLARRVNQAVRRTWMRPSSN